MRWFRRRPRPELPLDTADATGVFGLLSGVLSIGVPYFLGLTAALSALGLAVALPRLLATGVSSRWPCRSGPFPYVAAAIALSGWAAFAVGAGLFPSLRGAVLAASSVPLWWGTRRPIAFGGG